MQKHRFKDVLHIKVIIQSNHGRAINVAATPEDLSLETWEEKAEPLLKQEAERQGHESPLTVRVFCKGSTNTKAVAAAIVDYAVGSNSSNSLRRIRALQLEAQAQPL